MKIFQTSFMLLALGATVACAPVVDENLAPPTLSMNIPDSLTGGGSTTNFKSKISASTVTGSVQLTEPCTFNGSDKEDPFVNGYELSKFLVGQISTWTCISDLVISIVDFTVNDGEIHATDNIKDSTSYKSDDPTHYQVVRTGKGQTKMRLFYGYAIDNPPIVDDKAGLVLFWNKNDEGEISGLLSLDMNFLDSPINLEDPTGLRLEFNQTASKSSNDMFLIFDESNAEAEGMRVIVTLDKTALFSAPVYTVQALIKAKKQWLDVASVSEVPYYKLYAVTDKLGNGASRAFISDIAIPFEIATDNNLGDYLFDKTDDYYFDADISKANWQWVNKTVTKSKYVASRTTPATGGSWIPFSPSLDMLINAFQLDSDYFTAGKCELPGDSCDELLNAVFIDGFDDQESNQGSDPQDWRSQAMQNLEYLDSVYPNGLDWTGALEH